MAENANNNSDLLTALLVIAVLIGVVLYKNIYQSSQEEHYWQQGRNQTCGTVYGYSTNSENNASLFYEYYVDSVRYEGWMTDREDRFYGCEQSKRCIGYRFRVFYAVFKPELSNPDLEAACE